MPSKEQRNCQVDHSKNVLSQNRAIPSKFSKNRKYLQLSGLNLSPNESAKSDISKYVCSAAPVVETASKKVLPGFFEDEDVIAVIDRVNQRPQKQPREKKDDVKSVTVAPFDNPGNPEPSVLLEVAGANDWKGLSAPKSYHIHQKTCKTITPFRQKAAEDDYHNKFRGSYSFRMWHDLKQQFLESYEMKDGRQIHQAIKQLQDDEKHMENMLINVHRKKVALMYHLKYLCKAMRRNRTRAHHAAKLDKHVKELIHQTAAVQQVISKRTGIVALGVRSQLHQMKNILWTKLGMKEYKPQEPKVDESQGVHPSAVELLDQKGELLHIEGKADVVRMDQIQTLLDPINFKKLALRLNGLDSAQKYILNYLKQCAEVYPWLQNMKISMPTRKGVKRVSIKDLEYFVVDAHELFAGLERPADPLKILQEEFPTEKFHRRLHKEFNVVATMFQVEPLSGRHANESPPHGVFDKVFKVELPAKIKRVQREQTFMSFDEFSAVHANMFQHAGFSSLSETNPEGLYDVNPVDSPLAPDNLLSAEWSPEQNTNAEFSLISSDFYNADGTIQVNKKRGKMWPDGVLVFDEGFSPMLLSLGDRNYRKSLRDEDVERKAKAKAKEIHRALMPNKKKLDMKSDTAKTDQDPKHHKLKH